MEIAARFVNYVHNQSTWTRKRRLAKQYAYNLSRSVSGFARYQSFLRILAQNDLVLACEAAGVSGRYILSEYLVVDTEKVLDIRYIKCCLILDFKKDLITYLKYVVASLDEKSVCVVISEIRNTLDDILLLRFLRYLNHLDCAVDYIDDVFLDCPINTDDFLLEERRFCQEVYNKKKFELLYEYLASRGTLSKIAYMVSVDSLEDIKMNLRQYPSLGSAALLLSFADNNHFENILELIQSVRQSNIDLQMKAVIVLYCCMRACQLLVSIPKEIEAILKNLHCDIAILFQYRKYISHQMIACFKELLLKDRCLLEFIRLLGDNNTFASAFKEQTSMKKFDNKNKKYRNENKLFYKKLMQSDYTDEEKDFIRNNTHLSMYSSSN